jgi:hypothetical protein
MASFWSVILKYETPAERPAAAPSMTIIATSVAAHAERLVPGLVA